MSDTAQKPYILGIGGSRRSGSNTRMALEVALRKAESLGAEVKLLDASALNFPLYDPGDEARTPEAATYITEVRRADGIILATPSYHGSISGLVKNALDYVQDLVDDPSVYFSGRAVGLIATGGGWAGAINALGTLRNATHALRGWPTPLGVPIGVNPSPFGENGEINDPKLKNQLEMVATEVVDFARHTGTARKR